MAAADPASARLRIDAVTSDSPTILADAVARDRDGLALIDAATYAANRARLKRVALSGAESLRQSLTLYVSTQALGDAHFVAVLRHWMSRGARMAAEAGFEAAPAAGPDEPRRRAAAPLAQAL